MISFKQYILETTNQAAQGGLASNNFGGNKQWEQYALQEVKKQGLDRLSPSDAVMFFPNGKVTAEGWVNILSLLSYKESTWNPNTTYGEAMTNKKGEKVVSTGLFQLSYESVGYYGYKGLTTEQLKDPILNIRAAITIMKKGIEKTGRIEQNNSYWSVLRPNHRNYAGNFIKKGTNPNGTYSTANIASNGTQQQGGQQGVASNTQGVAPATDYANAQDAFAALTGGVTDILSSTT